MFIIGNSLKAVAVVLNYVLHFYMWIIIARAVLSWVNPDPYNPIVRFIHNVTEPVLYRIRRKLPLDFGGIDFSPIVQTFSNDSIISNIFLHEDFITPYTLTRTFSIRSPPA